MIKVILDTDIGYDVDDAMALIFALKSPEVSLRGVTTVYGDVLLKAKIAIKIMALAGIKDIPVAAGTGKPLLRKGKTCREEHEGKGLITKKDAYLKPIGEHAVDFIIRSLKENNGQITVIAIGPLTNIATAIIKEPTIVRDVKELIFVGGVARLSNNSLDVPAIEYNVKCDPEAARIVFNSELPITMLGMDVTRRECTRLNRQHLSKIRNVRNPLTNAAAELITRYWKLINSDGSCMHDVLAVAFSIDRSLVETEKLRVDVETRGRYTTGFTLVTRDKDKANADVGTNIAGRKFLKMFMERISSS